jgi:hypothetical protein
VAWPLLDAARWRRKKAKGICALTERISAGGTGEGKGRGHGRCCYRGSLFIALAVQLCFVLPQTVARKLTQWPVMPTNRS